MSTINFYRKETVLNDILNDKKIITVSNNQLNKMLLTTKNDKSNYIISYSLEIDDPDLDYINNPNDLTKLYSSYYGIDSSIKNEEVKNNIKFYNNCNFSNYNRADSYYYPYYDECVFGTVSNQRNGEKYINYNLRSIPHSLIFDYTYNSLYYLQYNKLNLMSYSISLKNGFNYDNHMLYFNIDNNYIKSVNNTLYYDYNKIRETTKQSSGISQIDDQYINTKNNYSYLVVNKNIDKSFNYSYNNIIVLNKDFKYDIFVTLNRLKNLYNTCENIYDIFSYYNTIDDYNNDYLNLFEYDNNPTGKYYNYREADGRPVKFYGITYKHTLNEIKFEDSKLYITDTQLGIYNQDISYEDTIYISDLNNVSFKMELPTYEYINAYNYSYYKSDFLLNVDNNVNATISYSQTYKFFTKKIKSNFIEISKVISESQTIKEKIITKTIDNTSRYLIGKTYNIKLNSTIDNNIFKNSGINIIYKGALYLNNEEEVEIINNSISYYNINPNDPSTSFDESKKINYETRTVAYYNHNQITLPIKKELNIRKIDGNIINNYKAKPSCNKKYFSQNSYFILSSKNLFEFSYINNLINNLDTDLKLVTGIYIYPNDDNIPQNNIIKIKIEDGSGSKVPININNPQIIGPEGWDGSTSHEHGIQNSVEPEEIKLKQGKIRINDDLFKELEKNNLIINGNDINNLHYYMVKPKYNKSNNSKYNEIYPVLNTYPNKYLNDKFFDSEAYKYTNYINDEELNTCIAEIKNIKYDDIDILYLYEIIDDYLPRYVFGGPIQYYHDGYKLIFYTLVKNNNSQDNLKITKCEDSDGGHILSKYDLYYDNIVDKNNIFFLEKGEYKNLYRYLKLYLNNSIRFY